MPIDAPATGVLTIGSRGSQLALWQARFVASLLNSCGVRTRIDIIRTTGDHLQTASLVQAGGKGLFTKEIEEALLAGAIDIAVHSLKDMPTVLPEGLAITAVLAREDVRDVFISRKARSFAELAQGAIVGTASLRRQAQVKRL